MWQDRGLPIRGLKMFLALWGPLRLGDHVRAIVCWAPLVLHPAELLSLPQFETETCLILSDIKCKMIWRH